MQLKDYRVEYGLSLAEERWLSNPPNATGKGVMTKAVTS